MYGHGRCYEIIIGIVDDDDDDDDDDDAQFSSHRDGAPHSIAQGLQQSHTADGVDVGEGIARGGGEELHRIRRGGVDRRGRVGRGSIDPRVGRVPDPPGAFPATRQGRDGRLHTAASMMIYSIDQSIDQSISQFISGLTNHHPICHS